MYKKNIIYWLLPAFTLFLTNCEKIKITDGITYEGAECYVVETPAATYYYEKDGGGFSRIVDKDGKDWIQFRNSGNTHYPFSAAADYRGLPNLVFRGDDDGAGHPGFEMVTSKLEDVNAIRSESKSGKWAWTWKFYKDRAVLSIDKMDTSRAYWFLYEGPIAGEYSPHTHYWGNDQEGPLETMPDRNNGEVIFDSWQWAYFGDVNSPRVFYVHQVDTDTISDTFSYLGNTDEGILANDGMAVFGFGRGSGATPFLHTPQEFIIGFYENNIASIEAHQQFAMFMENLP